jgi:type IV pilus assembly protein PilO
MPDLQQTRHKVKTGIIGMVVLCVAAVVVLFSPLVGSTASRKEQMDRLWVELKSKNQQVEPLRGMDKKVATAQAQILDFYKNRFPARGSDIYEELGKIQAQTGAKIQGIKYKADDEPGTTGLQRVVIEGELAGDYLQLVRFLNALERDRMFFMVNSVTLGSEQGRNVKLGIKLETYLRSGS